MNKTVPVLVTGAAGFIGYHLCERLLGEGRAVVGLDCINDYYDVKLKHARLERLRAKPGFSFHQVDLSDATALRKVFDASGVRRVVNLAAQAGVRYSLINPQAYIASNITGFTNILECCRHTQCEHLVYASSSSVYGGNTAIPFSTDQNVDHPVSLYAATKKSNELMAHCYSHLFKLPTSGLRFFTVYGPWGRPDMAAGRFVKAILAGQPIDVFNHGKMQRDFTYIDDIVEGVVRVLDHAAQPDPNYNSAQPSPATSNAPYRVYNIGNNNPVELSYFIELIERELGVTAKKNLLPMQPGDVPATSANVDDLMREVGFRPDTPIETGVARFVKWYREYYKA
jgi:UDP-glucuronate 4-epimerase